jgi:hypothetical protein
MTVPADVREFVASQLSDLSVVVAVEAPVVFFGLSCDVV